MVQSNCLSVIIDGLQSKNNYSSNWLHHQSLTLILNGVITLFIVSLHMLQFSTKEEIKYQIVGCQETLKSHSSTTIRVLHNILWRTLVEVLFNFYSNITCVFIIMLVIRLGFCISTGHYIKRVIVTQSGDNSWFFWRPIRWFFWRPIRWQSLDRVYYKNSFLSWCAC